MREVYLITCGIPHPAEDSIPECVDVEGRMLAIDVLVDPEKELRKVIKRLYEQTSGPLQMREIHIWKLTGLRPVLVEDIFIKTET